jgi:hypothetical protein
LLRGDKDLWGQANGCLNGSYSDLKPKICRVGVDGRDPDFLVWGDSHASAIVPVIDYVARARQLSGATALHTGCAPLLVGSTRVRFVNGSQCREVNLSVWNVIRTTGVKNVLLHARWANYVDHGSDEDLMEVFRMTLLQLQQLHINPIIIASVPEPDVDVPGALARAALSGVPPRTAISESEFAQRQERTFRLLENVAERFSVTIAYPHKVLCSGSICGYVNDRRPLYLDQHHLSVEGAMLLAPLFNGVLGQDLK